MTANSWNIPYLKKKKKEKNYQAIFQSGCTQKWHSYQEWVRYSALFWEKNMVKTSYIENTGISTTLKLFLKTSDLNLKSWAWDYK